MRPPVPDIAAETAASVLAEVRALPLRQSRFVTDVLSGGYRSTFRGAGVEFEEVREYAEGDDPRHVDWNVTARVGRPFVKRFVEEREHTLLFAVDRGASMHCGLGGYSPAGAVARLCALLALCAIDNHDRLGFVGGAGADLRFVPPRKGGRHAFAVVGECLPAPAVPGGPGLAAVLRATAGRQRRRAVVFVLSDFAGFADETALRSCAERHDVIAVRILPREVVEPPPVALRLWDPASGRTVVVDCGDRRTRAAWLAHCALRRAAVDAMLWRAQADRVDVVVPHAADVRELCAPLQRFFLRRQRHEVGR